MKMVMFAAIAGAAALAGAGAASAAPAGALVGGGAPLAVDADLVKVHGVHRTCERGPAGWHRSPRPGVRIACAPPRPVRPSGLYWSWRKRGNDWGWYHSRDRRWR